MTDDAHTLRLRNIATATALTFVAAAVATLSTLHVLGALEGLPWRELALSSLVTLHSATIAYMFWRRAHLSRQIARRAAQRS